MLMQDELGPSKYWEYSVAWEPHHLSLYWDNDVVSLNREECIKLLPVIQEFIDNAVH